MRQKAHPPEGSSRQNRFYRRLTGWALFCALLSVAFARPLLALTRYARESELYSYVVLVPLVSMYLWWLKRRELLSSGAFSVSLAAAIPLFAGVASLIAYWVLGIRGRVLAGSDYLSITIFSFVCFVIAGFLSFFGLDMTRRAAFPVGFLIFMAPFPTFFTTWLEAFLQHGSAEAASALFSLSGATVFREGLVFHLPGIAIEVAKECSGIHSSLVLFITSLVAGHLFLRSPWKKAALALVVIPLGIVRNGFRIFTIGTLCVHVSPNMIDSPLHRHGGPIFFVLSLVPFFGLLLLLRKSEGSGKYPESAAAGLPAKNG